VSRVPRITGNIPIEIFGHYTGSPVTKRISHDFLNYHCPFLNSECRKFRKSTPKVKIGTCTLGYKSRPVIVCPYRFDTVEVFDTIANEFIPSQHHKKVKWVKEVAIGKAGSVDYVATVYEDGAVKDFLCVEFQAGGTTGTPWQAIEEYKQHGKFLSESYKYGINWANQYLKTMMQQVLKKGKIVSSWGRHIVFVLQDVGMDYILQSGRGIKNRYDKGDPVQFFPFSLNFNEAQNRWILEPSGKMYSATLQGIQRILGGAEDMPTEDDFKHTIAGKGIKDGVFK